MPTFLSLLFTLGLLGCQATDRGGAGAAVRLVPAVLYPGCFQTHDGRVFGYRVWAGRCRPERVLIGLHGINGAAEDFAHLGRVLVREQPQTHLYALNLRGQGRDPVLAARGDILDEGEWQQDLRAFTRLLRKRHPGAAVIWMGESMGSLIALHTLADARCERGGVPPAALPDALILSSPVVSLAHRMPGFHRMLLPLAAWIRPDYRLDLEALAGGHSLEVTEGTDHLAQSATNPWHLSDYTLRLVHTLAEMVQDMGDQARLVDRPVLVLHGGRDIFSTPREIDDFMQQFPEDTPCTRFFFPGAYHLLYYDRERKNVIDQTLNWLAGLPGGSRQLGQFSGSSGHSVHLRARQPTTQ